MKNHYSVYFHEVRTRKMRGAGSDLVFVSIVVLLVERVHDTEALLPPAPVEIPREQARKHVLLAHGFKTWIIQKTAKYTPTPIRENVSYRKCSLQ